MQREAIVEALIAAQERHEAQRKTSRARALKQAAIQAFGNKCSGCGETFPPAIYEFHHAGVDDKANHLSPMFRDSKVDKIAAELAKCSMLCANCHRAVHDDAQQGGFG